MPRFDRPKMLAHATALRDTAWDLVAHHGDAIPIMQLDAFMQVTAYEGTLLAILYKCPHADQTERRSRSKDSTIEIWHDRRRTFSVQWGYDDVPEILFYTPGGWEADLMEEHHRVLGGPPTDQPSRRRAPLRSVT
jgi:hypothetical protein